MKTNISDTPAKDAGEFIHDLLRKHRNEPTLFLVSGGSALEVLSHIQPYIFGPHMLIGTTDDRFTRLEGNNFKQITETDFYVQACAQGTQFIDSYPMKNESIDMLVDRLQMTLDDFFKRYPENYTLGLFGIGEDGHTASIFPNNEAAFEAIYRTGKLYCSSITDKSEYQQRVTITPIVIEEVLSDVVLYAVGKNKCDNILTQMLSSNFTDYELPALIPARHPHSELFTDCEQIT